MLRNENTGVGIVERTQFEAEDKFIVCVCI